MSLLEGLRVIEISGNGAAAMAGKHFADWGADVIALEPAGGSPLRDEPPYYEKDGERRSGAWAWFSRGKTAVRAGPGMKLGFDGALRLCETADVVLAESDLTESTLGVAPASLRARLEGKTACVLIAPFAVDGPYGDYRATELGVNALGGWSSVLGEPGREPLNPDRGLVWRITGMFALVAALVALRHERQGGAPQFVELSAQAASASMLTAPWLMKSMLGLRYERPGSMWPLGVMECADGYVGVPPLTAMHWEMLCHLMEISDVLELPGGRDHAYRIIHSAELHERVKPWLWQRTRAQVFEEAQAFRLPAAQVQTLAGRLVCPQLAARGFWREADIDGKRVQVPRVTYSMKGVEPVALGPAREAKTVEPRPARQPKGGAGDGRPPFEGIRVLDLTAFWSGPYATMLLGTLGADVIKIESVQRPDLYRYQLVRPGQDHAWEWGPVWNDVNCDKRDVTLDLASTEGKAIFERLVAQADVVVSNFANRVMPNLGLSNERLLEINPRLIAVTMPGYGPGGPWEDYVGYAIAFEQLIFGEMNGYPDSVPLYGGGYCDPLVGLHTVVAIELALRYREETGRGTEVEVPQCEILDSTFAPEQIAMQHGAPVPSRRGNKHDWMAPHGAYAVAGDDQWFTLAVSSDEEFAALVRILERAELARDERFATVAARKANEAALDEIVAALTRERDGVELERVLQAAGVMGCRLLKAHQLAGDAGLRHIGFFAPVAREVTGTHDFKTWPFRFSGIDTSHKRPPPLLGEHTAEVLAELAGVTPEELARLAAARVTGEAPLG